MAHSNLVQSLERGVMIIDLVARSGSGLTLAELGDALELKRPTVFNLTRTLVAHRYLAKTSRPVRFLLGPAVLENAEAWRHREMAKRFAQLVEDLARKIPRSTVVLAEAMGGEVIAVHLVDKNRPGAVQHSATRRLAPYVHASTLCFLAFWPPEEEQAYFQRYPFQDYGAGVWGTEAKLADFLDVTRRRGHVAWRAPDGRFLVAFPIYSPDGIFMAAVGVSVVPEGAFSAADEKKIVAAVAAAVAAVKSPA